MTTTSWCAQLDGGRVAVEVPATTANLGAGYDCLGMALELTTRVVLQVRGGTKGGHELHVEGEGADELAADSGNRFIQGVEAAIREARGEIPEGTTWQVEMIKKIPLARGLGSSAAGASGGCACAPARHARTRGRPGGAPRSAPPGSPPAAGTCCAS